MTWIYFYTRNGVSADVAVAPEALHGNAMGGGIALLDPEFRHLWVAAALW